MKPIKSLTWMPVALVAAILFSQGCNSGNSNPPAPTPPAWGVAGRIESLAGSIEDFAAVVDGTGNVTVVWNQDDGSVRTIYASRFELASGNWSAPVPLESEDGGDAFGVQVAANSSGVVLAVWAQSTGPQLNVDYSRYVPGSGWSAATSIATNTNSTSQPSVAINADGNGFAMWNTGSGTPPDIFASRFTGSSGNWAAPDTIDSENLDILQPLVGGIGFLSNGDAVATWQQFDGFWQNVWANTWSATGGSWGAAERLEFQFIGAGRPNTAIGGDDSVMAVWDQGAIYGNRYTGTWSVETDLRTDTGSGGSMSAVAAAANGNAMAVWSQSNGSTNDIKTRLYTASGGSWGAVTAADTDDAVSMIQPSVATYGSGDFVVAWRENATPGNVWVNTYASGAWGTPINLDAVDGAVQVPKVLTDSAGRMTVIWMQEGSTASVYDMWAVRFQ